MSVHKFFRMAVCAALCLMGIGVAPLGNAQASSVTFDWATMGGGNEFNRQAISFAPIEVSSFLSFETTGYWRNEVNSTAGGFNLEIFLNLGGNWQRLAFMQVAAPAFVDVALDNFTFLPVDFSLGPLQGINFTEQTAGAGHYSNMIGNDGATQFSFMTPIPEPEIYAILGLGLGLLGWVGRRRKQQVA